MKTNDTSVDRIVAQARRTLTEGAEADRQDARTVRKEKFDASIAKKLEAADLRHASAVNAFEIENVEGMAGMIPLGLGEGPAWLVTMGKERRHEYASDIPLVGGFAGRLVAWTEEKMGKAGDRLMGPDNAFSNTLEHADKGAKLANDTKAEVAGIDGEALGSDAADAKDRLDDARDRLKQVLSDARAMEQERREAVRLASQI